MTELQAEFGDVDGAYDVFDKKVPVGHFVNRLFNLPIERMEVHKEFLSIRSHKNSIKVQLWINFGFNSRIF